ncbi:MAG: 7-cyano-7-deazaguanine synthase QueC [Planctomycetota bacterium]|jgi:7-cyano-7-deazaguanine synthase|nr:7-cyano-7-deazaguanine synthase QueC [Planctomycetota bacterium]
MPGKNAVILLSGGLDSATVLAVAASEGYSCHCLSFDYGQRNRLELEVAARMASARGASHRIAAIGLGAFGGSALTAGDIPVPKDGKTRGIPSTYVPARNTIFLSHGLALAEVLEAEALFIGVNSVDYSGYPDCRPEYIAAFQAVADLGTRRGVLGRPVRVRAPLQFLDKSEIVKLGIGLGVDYSRTLSCYDPLPPDGLACGECDSCRLRRDGFRRSGIPDPTRYRPAAAE